MQKGLGQELQRLFGVSSQDEAAPQGVGREGEVRALVLSLRKPADWQVLGRVWRGVQSDWGWPAPAIAVSGVDAMQLWFSLASPMPAAQAQQLLQRLQAHYLADIDLRRVQRWPAIDATAIPPVQHAPWVPALLADGNWSAFVAPDLAPVFDDQPWLDIEPNEEGQATLLRAIQPLQAEELERALNGLAPLNDNTGFAAGSSDGMGAGALALRPGALTVPPTVSHQSLEAEWAPHAPPALPGPGGHSVSAAVAAEQARGFLLRVMNDEGAEMALRLEAAKVLIQAR